MIIGIDEVGRGAWAGPICVAAVLWPDDAPADGLDDSKKLLVPKRLQMAATIRQHAASIGIGWTSARDIDKVGVTKALILAANQAFSQIAGESIDKIIIDGNLKLIDDDRVETIVKADGFIPAVMAASIIAKIARDSYMEALDIQFGQYQFGRHVGYGTKVHQETIETFGPCEHHRLSYSPLKKYVD